MSLTGDPDGPAFRAGISVFDVMAGLHGLIGVLAALHQRSETGRGPARRGEPAVVGDVGARQPDGGLHRGRRGPEPDGQRAPEPVPLRDDADGRPGHDHHRRQRPPVPSLCEVLGIRRGGRRPAVRDQRRPHRATARSCGPLLLEQLAKWSADDLFVALNKAGVPCGPINTIGEGVELAESLGLAPRVEVGEGDRAVDVVRNPITFSDAELRYDSPPPELGEHTRRDQGVAADRRRAGAEAMTAERTPTYRTGIGHVDARTTITLLGHDLAQRADRQDHLRRAGLLAGGQAPARRRRS